MIIIIIVVVIIIIIIRVSCLDKGIVDVFPCDTSTLPIKATLTFLRHHEHAETQLTLTAILNDLRRIAPDSITNDSTIITGDIWPLLCAKELSLSLSSLSSSPSSSYTVLSSLSVDQLHELTTRYHHHHCYHHHHHHHYHRHHQDCCQSY